ncbi:carbamoyl-phosphate synthase large subunit [Alkalithermobacter thermoalcaliphilus JW-YL-7 = DSM 7308]|uniref:Carbamoyl phosphate synthase large chain n=1 Tax=Alkalithermobacter thermoalcaliphilus JW-YL-7 = DSM 7308 TaxID=1121328 RepID=A0A150FND5_CLOPD|nr:Carbamoyl-phosphate synthase large subunit glutamine-dependent [[Clostridium] paradoxum JW-YL-7 = DSM 7308]SHK91369.1 carbamoyl-phosphate synthase large subunit [[Clostridium] paradoxum JW-YL-7 = DSM 7308]
MKKVMIIGSGPIIIGQAAEFDYSGTQACKAIKEEGIQTILVNSNPATIMTDSDVADKVYIEPINIESIERIIQIERPDGIIATFGGQTALNIATKLDDEKILEKYNVKLLGTSSETIKKAEDREAFKQLMIDINEPVANSIVANHIDECIEFAKINGYPIIIRPAYTLGGTGGGIANNYDELIKICTKGLKSSPIGQILLEQSVAGWKEIEYEVIRDAKDNCIVVCNMENIDPVGIHTGDSIVVAPSQTLRDTEYQMLRKSAIKIVKSLDVKGACNVQFALDPNSDRYIVIEVNPRVSRSSALASKATGYPIAKISAKIALGYTLDKLKNSVTQNSSAYFEPALDYVVVKMPRFPFDKFKIAHRALGTQMKATGEVMAISRSFEDAFLKALKSLDQSQTNLNYMGKSEVLSKIKRCDDERIFAIIHALKIGVDIDQIHNITKIDKWFLHKIKNIDESLDINKDKSLVYKMVDTCAGEFDAKTPYYYSCFDIEDESQVSDKQKIIIIGSGPIRIGQGIEFDYCCVHGVLAAKEAGYEAIMINNNPETVSTDFDIADKLYFEPLDIDYVMNIINKEKPKGVIVQFGGQTSINLAKKLHENGVNILGTSFESIDLAEDRDKFGKFLEGINIKTPEGDTASNINEAINVANKLGYPLVVRPSYVIGGRAMQVVYDEESLINYMKQAFNVSKDHPILIDKYIKGIEIEVDAICDADDILIPGIMEHVERTGVHSGDSISLYPAVSLSEHVIDTLVEYTKKISTGLKTVGLINIQYVYDGQNVYVIEVNPRASRTVPILSKVTQVPMVKIATNLMLGKKLRDYNYETTLMKNKNIYAVKVPVFSSEKIVGADMHLGPEMKSTGEVLGIDKDLDIAIYKGFIASNINIPLKGSIYVSIKDEDKKELLDIIKEYKNIGFKIYASKGTHKFLLENNLDSNLMDVSELKQKLYSDINIIINTPSKGNITTTQGYEIRKAAIENKVPIFTSLDTARLFLRAMKVEIENKKIDYKDINEYFSEEAK